MDRIKPIVLAIVDGWGVAPPGKHNALSQAKTPHIDRFLKEYPAMSLYAHGEAVGLMKNQHSDAHIGHLNIGAGRICYQMLPRINASISDGSFFENKAFGAAVEHVQTHKSKLHIIGILSNSGFHGDIEHIYALLRLAKKEGIKKVYVHAILDGESISETSGVNFVKDLVQFTKEIGLGSIASICGRYYAMDRDGRWERISNAYRAIALGDSLSQATNPVKAIEDSYAQNIFDKKFVPTVITKSGIPVGRIEQNDAVIFSNFRSDRARQLTKAFVLSYFSKFERSKINNLLFVTMSMYEKELPVLTAFRPLTVYNSLAEVVSKEGRKQLHIAETEKYPHITYFLNGYVEEAFEAEDRELVPSPPTPSYEITPCMSARMITKNVIKAVNTDTYHAIFVNYTNLDSIARTGNMAATIKASQAVDASLGKLSEYVRAKDGVLCITSSVGGAEEMMHAQNGKHIGLLGKNPVPFIIVSDEYRGIARPFADPLNGDLSLIKPSGILADVAPTILKLLGIQQPQEMTGRALV